MQKVVLINPSQYTKYPQPPMGLAQLAAILKIEGHQVKVIDANAEKYWMEDIIESVEGADVVGLTAMTPTINEALHIANYLKYHYPDLTVILGGAHPTLLPEETMRTSGVDIVVRGEGDDTIIELLRALKSQKPLDNVLGITYRQNKAIISNPDREYYVNMDSLPYLGYHLLPWKKYRPHPPHGRSLPFMAMITSRGCPYNCAYCSKSVFGSKFRSQTSKRVVGEIAYYQRRFGVKEIAFYDDVFTLDRDRTFGIADEILNLGLKIDWTCETRANLVDVELLKQMKKAGCYSVSYGVESASQKILDLIDKNITLEQNEEAVRKSREVGLQTVGYFMIGSPKETPETIRQTIKLAQKLKLDYAQFSITTPFPGTKLYELYDKSNEVSWNKFVYAGTGSQVSPVFESDTLSRDEIQDWIVRAYKEFYLRLSYIWQRMSRIRTFGDLRVLLKGVLMLVGNLKE